MNTKEIENIDAFSGHEGTQIRQIFLQRIQIIQLDIVWHIVQ